MAKQLKISRETFIYLCREMERNWRSDHMGMMAMELILVKLESSSMNDGMRYCALLKDISVVRDAEN